MVKPAKPRPPLLRRAHAHVKTKPPLLHQNSPSQAP